MGYSALFTRRGFRSALRGAVQYVFGKRGERRIQGWRVFTRLRVQAMLHGRFALPGIGGSAAKLWVDGEAFPRVKKLLRAARHTIYIQMFIWKDDRLGRQIVSILLDAADDGVRVEIFKEAVGDVFELHQDFLSTRHSNDKIWKRFWNHPNIRITHSTRNDHAKVYIIDDKILLLSGMNIADEYHEEWHDYMVELRGRGFVDAYLTEGDRTEHSAGARLVMNTGNRVEIRSVVMDLIASAKQSIVLEHCYFSDPDVVDALSKRTKEGIQVVVIVPAKPDLHHYSNMQAIGNLLKQSNRDRLSVFLYPAIVHGKIMLVDRERAFVGSANIMTESLDSMGEVNVLLEGKTLPAIGKLRDVLREDILISTPMANPPRFVWLWRWLTWLKL
jgi:cardiolipin synthase